jgi:hypothetical protein
MKSCPAIDQHTIRQQCELIRNRWDAKTEAERRATALALQRELAWQLGLVCKPAESSDAMPDPSTVGAA